MYNGQGPMSCMFLTTLAVSGYGGPKQNHILGSHLELSCQIGLESPGEMSGSLNTT